MKRLIAVTVILLALIPSILLGYAINHYAQSTIKTEKLDTLAEMVRMIDLHLSRYYDRIIYDVRMKTENDILKSVLVKSESEQALTRQERTDAMNILLEYIGFQVIGGAVIDREGKTVLSSSPEDEGLMMNQTELYKTIMNGKDSYIGLVTVDTETDIVEIAAPIHDAEGRIIGVLKQNAEIYLLDSYLSSLNLGESGHAFLICRNGYMLYDNKGDKPTMLYHEYQNNNSLEQLVTAFKTGRLTEEKGFIEFGNSSCEYIGAYKKVNSVDCIAVVAVKKGEVFGQMVKVKEVVSVAVLLLFILIAACGFIISYLHAKPLKTVNHTLKKIGNGDLTVRCSYKGVLEFEELCRNINSLADGLQKSEKELRMSSRIDNLTHLPNRNAIYELLDTLLYKHPNQALLLLEVEGFKNVNDNLGYDIGDRILMEVGDILRDLPQHVCYPSRISGAEFLVFITNWTALKYPEKIAEKIIRGIEGIRFIDEVHVDIGASIGIEYTEEEKSDKKKLIKHCSIAMHKAKLIGRNSYFVHYPYMQKEM